MNKFKIIKAFGKEEPFSEDKLHRSLLRSGASEVVAREIMQQIKSQLYDGMTTKELYQNAFELLRQLSPVQASRYKLKHAINELGPSGFPFERFVAELLKYEGYKAQTGVIVDGHCVKHELDVIAQKGLEYIMIECKFHHGQGVHSDVKVPLYIYARFLDVVQRLKELHEHSDKNYQAWIVTNTRFTTDAQQYGSCMGLNLISWDHPHGQSLRNRIDRLGLYPLTSLQTLTAREKQLLLDKEIVLCHDICNKPELLALIGVTSGQRVQLILNESQQLCKHFNMLSKNTIK